MPVSDSTPSTVEDVLAAEPVIRRIVASRVTNPADVDDLVHDCLERLLRARGRLARDTVLPFGIVTARNLVISQARTRARHAASAPFVLDLRQPQRPDDAAVADERREAVTAALDRLSPDERRDLIAYHTPRSPSTDDDRRGSPGAIRVRMARTRAKARLEYLLALRRVRLPTPVCRRVLLAVSGGDTRRQVALGAGEHLIDCPTCAGLSEALEKRSLALAAVVFPVAVAGWVAGKVRAHPASTALTSVAAAATTAAVVAATTLHPSKPVARPHPQPIAPAPPATRPLHIPKQIVTGLSIRGVPVEVPGSLRAAIGQRVDAAGVAVEEVDTRNGFWVGPTPSARVWVELVGARRNLHIVKGDHLGFVGSAEADSPSYPSAAQVTAAAGADLLKAEAAHVAVPTTSVTVEP